MVSWVRPHDVSIMVDKITRILFAEIVFIDVAFLAIDKEPAEIDLKPFVGAG